MTWAQRYHLKQTLRNSLVFWAVVALVAALVCAALVRRIDREEGWRVLGITQDGARAVLSALSASMLTFIVFVLSATLIVVQLASGQLTPRIVKIVFTMRWVKFTLALFTFTYAYTLSALARVEDRVPDLHVGFAVLLNLACIVAFFLFVQNLSTGLRSATMMRFVASRGHHVIDDVYPLAYDPARPEQSLRTTSHRFAPNLIEYRGEPGAVMAFSETELVQLARDADAVLELIPQVGDYLADGDPMFRSSGGSRQISPSDLHGCLAVGEERTLDQDPRLIFRILVDIAIRALSPAVNDPTTAVLSLDQIHHLLHWLGRKHLGDGEAHDRDGKVRLVYGTPDWPDYVILAVSEIRQYGQQSIQVVRRLKALLQHLIEVLPEARRPPLMQELTLVESAIERGFRDEVDRKRAGIGDYQGVGGSDT
jgi:uncharacterized membrane protein